MKYTVLSILEKAHKRLTDGTGRAVKDAATGYGAFCMYRAPDGNKCVVGDMITDTDYRVAMDNAAKGGTSITSLLEAFPHLPQYMRDHKYLLRALQQVHDSGGHWNKETNQLNGAGAGEWNLVVRNALPLGHEAVERLRIDA